MHQLNKGKNGERELAKVLNGLGFAMAQRGAQRKGGEDSPDVLFIQAVHIECKRVEALDLRLALEQSIRDAGPNKIPTVCHRRNRKPWLITLQRERFKDFQTAILSTGVFSLEPVPRLPVWEPAKCLNETMAGLGILPHYVAKKYDCITFPLLEVEAACKTLI